MARARLHVDSIRGRDDFGMECSPVRKQAVIGISLELLSVYVVVGTRHDRCNDGIEELCPLSVARFGFDIGIPK